MLTSYPSWQLLLTGAAYGLLLWVIWNGQLRRSRFAAPVAGAVVSLLVGLLFKVQHWEGSTELLVGSGVALAGLYGTWFARKTPKTRLAVLKLSYALSLGLWAAALGLGWRPLLPWLSSWQLMSLWAVLLDFGYVRYLRRPAAR
ncbi:hypothetical protein [Hymenobacter psychrophilus]|uniref:Uncharacterized protein n=1 Tax=Hymenobacter psychrophilus TaxID=651662 RepID=A0A1H3BLW1_9BACT|nr:hypothetical protein [Hymenobacter psychrophilus]SDX42711.1 hypothetical protein SAMN04488069_101338 [Hymenobacter psychrophilus]